MYFAEKNNKGQLMVMGIASRHKRHLAEASGTVFGKPLQGQIPSWKHSAKHYLSVSDLN